MGADERGSARGRRKGAPGSGRAAAGSSRSRRRWLWRTFFLGLAIGLVWAGWNQAVADVRTIRQLFGF